MLFVDSKSCDLDGPREALRRGAWPHNTDEDLQPSPKRMLFAFPWELA